MPFDSNLIAQNIASQTALVGNQATYAQQISAANGLGSPGFMPTYPSPAATNPAMGGAGAIFSGISAMGGATPFTNQAQTAASQMATGMIGMVASPQTPLMGQMFRGLQEQQMVNSALQQSFSFQGTAGRGFSGGQQAQIGQFLQGTAQRDVFASLPELTRLVQGGAEMGHFQAVRDVQQFKQRFNTMLSSLREISRTLGTTLEEAQQFTKQMQQIGVFSPGAQTQMAQQLSGMSLTSGIGMNQLAQFGGQFGNVMNRAVGAERGMAARAGVGVLGGIGTAARQGLISEQQIYEATGMSGLAGRQALGQTLMGANARFLRRGAGNISVAAFVDPSTGQIDTSRLNQYMSGQIGRGEMGQMARQNIAQMGGAAEWQANRGAYRAKFMESTQGLGPLALMMGVMPDNIRDDPTRSRLWLKRRTGMSMSEIDALMPMIQNFPQMMQEREEDQNVARRQQQYRRWAEERGPAGMKRKFQKRMEEFTSGSFKDFSKNLQQGIEEEITRMVDETYGVYEEYLSAQGAERFKQEIRRGSPGQTRQELIGLAGSGRAARTLAEMRATAPTSGERLRGGLGRVTEAFRGQGVMAGLRAGKRFVGAELPDVLSDWVGVGMRSGASLAKKMGLSIPMPMEGKHKIYSGTATSEDVGMAAGELERLVNDKGLAGAITGSLSPDQSESENLSAAKRALMDKYNLTDEQAEALAYKAFKQNSHVKEVAKNLGAHLPYDYVGSPAKTAEEAGQNAQRLYKEVARGAFGTEDKWKDLRDLMQDDTVREAFHTYMTSEGDKREGAQQALEKKLSSMDKSMWDAFKNLDGRAKDQLHMAMAYTEQESLKLFQKAVAEKYGAAEGIDLTKFGTASEFMAGVQADIAGLEKGDPNAMMTLQGKLDEKVASIKDRKELNQLTESLRKGGQGQLADEIERQWKEESRLVKYAQRGGRRGQGLLGQKALQSFFGGKVGKEQLRIWSERLRKGKEVTMEMLEEGGRSLKGEERAAYQEALAGYREMSEGGIDVEEARALAKETTGGVGEGVKGRGETKTGGIIDSLDKTNKALSKDGAINKTLFAQNTILTDIKHTLQDSSAPKGD